MSLDGGGKPGYLEGFKTSFRRRKETNHQIKTSDQLSIVRKWSSEPDLKSFSGFSGKFSSGGSELHIMHSFCCKRCFWSLDYCRPNVGQMWMCVGQSCINWMYNSFSHGQSLNVSLCSSDTTWHVKQMSCSHCVLQFPASALIYVQVLDLGV